jgi:hypothetical protein
MNLHSFSMSAPQPDRFSPEARICQPGDGMAQFLLTDICPFEGIEPDIDPAKVLALLPRPIWLSLDRKPRGIFECKGKKWVVPNAEAHRHRSRAGYTETIGDRVVCEHMGHLIE